MYNAGKRVYNNILYSTGYSGIVYAYDINTGKNIWTYTFADPYQAKVL
ncbi:MAG: PQQ-binding-like beta-propeller repeat protein [Crenarchaeota archaeon]|nr:PQQ-binding-like beta-propeller repeat protein [Thermoproteota archaeon]